ncbi:MULTISPECIES: peptidase inhibitor family I36 protein [Thermomonosporaceae]|uniref:peptidase inhibitor family I36 protein n=1 Tax=Thermomonosporaceae TaxID=2012 RepID=UPI00255ADFAB|nr:MULTISPECIES: peptidase inhibitor family I36 protein [Thermomonosporaceae]MDL4773167.1 peptidase inhibitor family I36 protein [Actinomadura xylanilytica]
MVGALAAAAVFVGTGVIAPTASADSNPSGCPQGYFCAYSKSDQKGSLLLKVDGKWSGSIKQVGSVFNNGVQYPGADHAYVTYAPGSGSNMTRCLHFNPGPGHKANISGSTLKSVTWGGECP